MKVAVAAEGSLVSPHFGRCSEYVVAELGDGRVLSTERISNPGHEPGRLPRLLGAAGVECIIAGGMGMRAKAMFDEMGIQFVTGVSGAIEDVLGRLAAGELEPGEETCDH